MKYALKCILAAVLVIILLTAGFAPYIEMKMAAAFLVLAAGFYQIGSWVGILTWKD